jgi:hypothetical protein
MTHDRTKNTGALMGLLIGLLALTGPAAIAQTPGPLTPAEEVPYLRPRTTCPRDLDTLVTGLIRDLPGYANRVARRSLGVNQEGIGLGTILLAGRAELEPIAIDPAIFSESGLVSFENTHQVFFTTLEREYTATSVINLEQYHWLFLTPAEGGWRLALMFSRIAADEAAIRPPTPPRESSDGIIGQAVQLWLRDCRAGAVEEIAPLAPGASEAGEVMGR